MNNNTVEYNQPLAHAHTEPRSHVRTYASTYLLTLFHPL